MEQNAIPFLIIDYLRYPDLADNIWQAQKAGFPQRLTYNGPGYLDVDKVTRQNRKNAMLAVYDGLTYEIPRMWSRDEYPFACTQQGGIDAWVGHIPAEQNSAQGGLIASFVQKFKLKKGKEFHVEVINHPRGHI